MPHEIQKEDQHKWENIPVILDSLTKKETDEVLLSDYRIVSVHLCTRGDCRCLKVVRKKYGQYTTTYSRSGTLFNIDDRPDCFGDTPINEQKID